MLGQNPWSIVHFVFAAHSLVVNFGRWAVGAHTELLRCARLDSATADILGLRPCPPVLCRGHAVVAQRP